MATATFYPPSRAFGLGIAVGTMPVIADCNAVTVTGWSATGNNTQTTNRPSGVSSAGAVVYTVVRGDLFAYQEWYDFAGARVFRRFKQAADTWTAWTQI